MFKKYFNKDLKVEYINGLMNLYMTDEKKRISYFDDLSDGQKSLLTIIFLFSNDFRLILLLSKMS